MIINNKPSFYIDVNTHKATHTVCIINVDTDKLITFTFKNEPRYYKKVIQKILNVTKNQENHELFWSAFFTVYKQLKYIC